MELPKWLEWFGASAGGGQSSGVVNPSQPIFTVDEKGSTQVSSGSTNSPADRVAKETQKNQPTSENSLFLDPNRTGREVKQPISYTKKQLQIYKFPSDLEEQNIPHILFKVFETTTGSVARTDITSNSIINGTSSAVNAVQKVSQAIGGEIGEAASVAGIAKIATGSTTAAIFGAAATTDVGSAVINDAANLLFGGGTKDGQQRITSRAKQALEDFALKRNIQQLKTAIALFMPEGITTNYDNDYGQLSVTGTTGLLGGLAQAFGSPNGLGGTEGNPFIMEAAFRAAGQDLTQLGLFATTGRTLNPQLELIYNSPKLRTFMFDFRLIPRNATESQLISKIIYLLKFYSAPTIPENETGRYFIPPAQFEIEFYDSKNQVNRYFFKTKKCVLSGISVDYTPNGVATFRDGAPVEIRLQLQFQETAIIDRSAVNNGY